MEKKDNMKQEVKKGAVAIQGQNININGLSREDIEGICKGIFYDNFMKLRDEAQIIVNARIQQFSEELYRNLEKSKLLNTQKFKIPDIQYMLFEAQKAYVRNEEPEMCQLIVDLITHRIEAKENTNLQLNINQAITMISKLNIRHINILTLIFIISNVKFRFLENARIPGDEEIIKIYIENKILPYVDENVTNTDMEYLSSCGCGTQLLGSTFEEAITQNYPNLFKNINEGEYNGMHKKINVLIEDQYIDLEKYITSINQNFKKIFDVYNRKYLYTFDITSVAKLVAIYNIQRVEGVKLTISEWIKN